MEKTILEQDAIERLTSTLNTSFNWWVPIPANASPQERRSYSAAAIALPFGAIGHIFFLFLFAYWKIPALVIANIISILIYVAGGILLRNNKMDWAMLLTSLEVIVHSSLVIYFVGWGLGIQYFMFLFMLAVVVSKWSLGARLVTTLISIAFFLLFYYYALGNPPQVAVDLRQLNLVNILTTSSAFLTSAAIMFYTAGIADQLEAQLEIEHEKSEGLLNNILPAAISVQLKNNRGTIADYIDGASILFADVVDFTPMSATMTPEELVELLNEVFSDFDVLTEKYGLEKIKTIGDCYMVASGVPQPRDDHAQVLTQMALEMQERVNNHAYNGHKLAFRIGINSGPVVAGVIGRKKFSYDLWGDTVNTASRMESHGYGGHIQITRATYALIKDDFICEPQGTVDVKGKGEMEIWHVSGAVDG